MDIIETFLLVLMFLGVLLDFIYLFNSLPGSGSLGSIEHIYAQHASNKDKRLEKNQRIASVHASLCPPILVRGSFTALRCCRVECSFRGEENVSELTEKSTSLAMSRAPSSRQMA